MRSIRRARDASAGNVRRPESARRGPPPAPTSLPAEGALPAVWLRQPRIHFIAASALVGGSLNFADSFEAVETLGCCAVGALRELDADRNSSEMKFRICPVWRTFAIRETSLTGKRRISYRRGDHSDVGPFSSRAL